jgi:hypothetical protein
MKAPSIRKHFNLPDRLIEFADERFGRDLSIDFP